jgi:hypothetical protein
MPDRNRPSPHEREVAMWHKLSAMPDDVTDEGIVVHADPGEKLRAEKRALRAMVAQLSRAGVPEAVRTQARLAASYLLAGDMETARRYLEQAERTLERNEASPGRAPP